MKILVGADPEFFISKDGKIVWPTPEIFPGDKKNPFKVNGGAVQIDGAAIEININPAETAEEFDHNIECVMKEVFKILPTGYVAEKTTAYSFPRAYYNSIPKEYRVIGCDPDFNAYSGTENVPYSEDMLRTYRMVGGHVHIGWTENEDVKNFAHVDACRDVVKQMDVMLKTLQLFTQISDKRESYYGCTGNYRPKPYGVEYRTPSNWWIWSSRNRKLVFDQVQKGMKYLIDDDNLIYNSNKSLKKYVGIHSSPYNYEYMAWHSLPQLLYEQKIVNKEDLLYLLNIFKSNCNTNNHWYIFNAIEELHKRD